MALPITFWHQGNENAETTVRQVELACWSDVAGNYAGDTRTRLASLMDGFKPAKNNGRLLLWHGEPGTGKTFAIRALGWAWKEWCRFEYVIDPEQLFDRGELPYRGRAQPEVRSRLAGSRRSRQMEAAHSRGQWRNDGS